MGQERLGDLEISQDLAFEQRSWAVQRISWGLFGLLFLAGLLGLLGGPGPLSHATAGEGSPLEITYDRFARHNNPTELALQVQPAAGSGDELRLWLSAAYLDAVQVEQITPEPSRVESGGGRLTYVFALGSADAGVRVVLHILPQHVGRHELDVGVEGGPEQRLSQIVYP